MARFQEGPPTFNPGTKQDDDRKPIGVPKGYTVPVQRSWTPSPGRSGRVDLAAGRYMVDQGPRYMAGDEWKPANNSPAGIAEAQKMLAAAGLLKDWRYGVWDEPTRKAWIKVLGYANSRGITDRMALIELASAPRSEGGGTDGGGQWTVDENGNPVFVEEGFQAPPLQLKLPNKQDVERVLRSSVIEKLGEGWDQQQIGDLADMYIAKVRGVQEDAYRQEIDRMEDEFYGREGASEPITTVEAPSLETFAEDELRRRDPGGFEATQVAEDYAPAFFAALGGYS